MWLPTQVREELAQGRVAADAASERLIDRELQQQLETAKRFTAELRLIDPLLEMVWITEPRGWVGDAPYGIVWNRWHVMRHNPDAANSFIAITDEQGGYVEPTSRVFDKLRSQDLWRGDVRRKEMRRRAEEAGRKERENDALRAECREEIALRLKSLENPSIRFGGSWTAKAGKASK